MLQRLTPSIFCFSSQLHMNVRKLEIIKSFWNDSNFEDICCKWTWTMYESLMEWWYLAPHYTLLIPTNHFYVNTYLILLWNDLENLRYQNTRIFIKLQCDGYKFHNTYIYWEKLWIEIEQQTINLLQQQLSNTRASKIWHELITWHEHNTNKWIWVVKFDTIIKWAGSVSTIFFCVGLRLKFLTYLPD